MAIELFQTEDRIDPILDNFKQTPISTPGAPPKVSVPSPVSFTAREQVFRVDIKGLRPSTPHYMYFERRLVSASNIKPLGGSLGGALVTDTSGNLVFDFYYQADLPPSTSPVQELQRAASLVAGVKEVVVSNINESTLPSDYALSSSSYFAGYIGISVLTTSSIPDASTIDDSVHGSGIGAGVGGPGND
jgi:hypothetical protein